jgi:broad specificity phosphatase PhoE
MTKILIIRHGQSVANLEETFAGHTDTPLSDLGKRQAEVTAEFIVSNYKRTKIC